MAVNMESGGQGVGRLKKRYLLGNYYVRKGSEKREGPKKIISAIEGAPRSLLGSVRRLHMTSKRSESKVSQRWGGILH